MDASSLCSAGLGSRWTIRVVSAVRAAEIEQATVNDQSEGWSRPVLFYPDGSTSTALIVLSNESIGRVVVKIRGITGDVEVSAVLAEEGQ